MATTRSLEIRRSEWESFANQDPLYYICTEVPKHDPDTFWQSGEDTVNRELIPLLGRYSVRSETALELGCGVGRLVFPMTKYFRTVIGLDIAPTMVSKATSAAAQRGIRNARFITIEQPENTCRQLSDYGGKVDFVYSLLVFQHIDDFGVVSAYLNLVSQILSPTGIGYLQFDTRPAGALYRAKTALPDALLPHQWRRGIRRIRQEPDEIESCFARNSLTLLASVAPRTEDHRYIVQLQS